MSAAPTPHWQMFDPQGVVQLQGLWTLRSIGGAFGRLRRELSALAGREGLHWDLRMVERLDSSGAALLWQAWGRRLPAQIALHPQQSALFAQLQQLPAASARRPPAFWRQAPEALGAFLLGGISKLTDTLALSGRLLLDLLVLLRHPGRIPWREISATLYHSGPGSLAIVGLVSFLLGVVLCYQAALVLSQYGANIYIVNMLGLGILREIGPLMAAIILAGRSGSAFTAQLGVMRLTDELDALGSFGVSLSERLILPKVLALALALPLLVLWSDICGLVGAMLVAQAQLDIGYVVFLQRLPEVVAQVNLWIGVGKGVLFGILIALVAAVYGLGIRPDSESLARETTHSVVTAITLVILMDALVAFVFADVGLD